MAQDPARPEDPRRVAAFFDLDKTVIAKASMVAFSRPLHRAGMLSRRLMLKAAWGQLVYQMWGASPEKIGAALATGAIDADPEPDLVVGGPLSGAGAVWLVPGAP